MPYVETKSFLTRKKSVNRILLLERNVMFPLKVLVVFFSFNFLNTLDPSPEVDYYFSQLKLYVAANVFFLFAIIGFSKQKFGTVIIKVSAFFLSMIDNLYLSFLIYFSGGLSSELYIIYPALLARNAINFPEIRYQQAINLSLIFFYVGAVYCDNGNFSFLSNEVFYLRIIMLVLTSFCCWGIYFIIKNGIKKNLEMNEHTLRSEKLNLAAKLTSQVAHELKNPLGIINNAVYIIKKNAGADIDKILRNAEIIQHEVRRSDKIISELLDYSSLADVKVVRVNVNQFINEFLSTNYPAESCNGEIVISLHGHIPELLIDKNQLSRILSHLLKNAFESMDGLEKKEVNIITSFADDETLAIEVTDKGSGIDEENLDRVFAPFYTTKSNHVGLGLSIVKNIVETYGGNVNITSADEPGCRVQVCFPVKTNFYEVLDLRCGY